MSTTAQSLRAIAEWPHVAAAIDEAREACTQLRWHNALRRRIPQAAAESRIRGAAASASLDGARFPVAYVRSLIVGLEQWPTPRDPMTQRLEGACRVTAETEHVRSGVVSAPAGALTRLHAAAARDLVPSKRLARPRTGDEGCGELVAIGEPLPASDITARLSLLADVVSTYEQVPAVVIAAVAHGELATVRPFSSGNGLVARAFDRTLGEALGLDPTGVAVPEMGYAREGVSGYVGALSAYASGTPEGVGLWVEFCAKAWSAGAHEGGRIANAVLAGRLQN